MYTKTSSIWLSTGNGEEAVEIYRDKQDRIDLILMDMVMPGIGGGEAIDMIKKINPQAKIILASFHPETRISGWKHLDSVLYLWPETLF